MEHKMKQDSLERSQSELKKLRRKSQGKNANKYESKENEVGCSGDTHSHTHTPTHMRKRIHTHTHICTQHADMCTHRQIHTHINKYICSLHAVIHTCSVTQTNTSTLNMYISTERHTHTCNDINPDST